MTPTFTTLFDLANKKLIVTDTYDYSLAVAAYGNVTVKIGNQIIHTNTNFDSSADIVYGINTDVLIDLPLNADGTIRETDYEVIYDVHVIDNLLGAVDSTVASATFTVATIPSDPTLAATVTALIAQGIECRITFNEGSTSGYVILSMTATTVTIASTTIAAYASISNASITRSLETGETTHNYAFCDTTPIAELCVDSDCFYATLTAQDTTPYLATQTILARALTINWPRLASGNAVEAPVVTSDASQTVGPNLYTGDFLVTLSTQITWTQTDGLLVSNTVAARNDYTVNCDINICTAFNCIKAYAVKYQQAVALGSRELEQFQQQNFQILIYCNLYNLAIECQKTAEAKAILEALGAYMSTSGVTVSGCDCGCGSGSTNSTEPTAIYPLYNSAVYNSATETARGIAELATQAETNTGTDDERIVTPLKLKTLLDARNATEATTGLSKIAPQSETDFGQNDSKFVTPLKLQKRLFEPSNTAAGTTVATLNTINGLVNYSKALVVADVAQTYTLNNSLITVDSIILWSVKQPNTNLTVLFPCSYYAGAGIAYFTVGILLANAPSGLKINFTIINP